MLFHCSHRAGFSSVMPGNSSKGHQLQPRAACLMDTAECICHTQAAKEKLRAERFFTAPLSRISWQGNRLLNNEHLNFHLIAL